MRWMCSREVLHCFLWRVGSNSYWNCHWLLKKYFDSDGIGTCLRDVSIVFSEWCIAQLARIPAPRWEASKRPASWFHSRIRNLGIEISSMNHHFPVYSRSSSTNQLTNQPACSRTCSGFFVPLPHLQQPLPHLQQQALKRLGLCWIDWFQGLWWVLPSSEEQITAGHLGHWPAASFYCYVFPEFNERCSKVRCVFCTV